MKSNPLSEHLRFASRYALVHWLGSAIVVLAAYSVIVFGWYPGRLDEMLGVGKIFIVVVLVDLVCGPLLTLIIATRKKSRRQLLVDVGAIMLVQMMALSYGVWSIFEARPVVIAFEVDRFTIATANEVQKELLGDAPTELSKLPVFGMLKVSLREASNSEEYLRSLELSLQGVTQSMRPNWWAPYHDEARKLAFANAKPIANLYEKWPDKVKVIEAGLRGKCLGQVSLRYLPVTFKDQTGWTAFINQNADIVGYFEVDGFD